MPESQHTEWKERWRDEYLAQVCGFANAQGGTLVIGHTWDGAPLPGVTPDDLSPAAFKRFRQLALRSRRLDEESLADSNAGLLDRLKLAEGAYLKRAAVLLFHPDPSRHFTGAFVKIGYFEHDAHIRYHDPHEAPLSSHPAHENPLRIRHPPRSHQDGTTGACPGGRRAL